MANPARELFRGNRTTLLLTYGATVAENLFDLLYPFAIGLAIDDLLRTPRSSRGLVVFVAIWAAHTLVGVLRQRYDTRVFAGIYAEVATDLVTRQRAAGADASSVVARATLARELVDFLESDVPRLVAAVFAVVGSLVMLLVYDPLLAGLAALLVVPVAVLNRRLGRRSQRLHAEVNDELEREADLVAGADAPEVATHYRRLAANRIALSDTQATTWGLLEVLTIGLSVFAFVRTTDLTAEAGAVFATVSYLFAYTAGFEDLPELSQRLANLGDIARRLAVSAAPGSG